MCRLNRFLALILIALPFAYRGFTRFWGAHLVDICAQGILENEAAELRWSASTLQPALSSCKSNAIASMLENMDFFAIRLYRLVPTVCREIRECLHHEVEEMMGLSRADRVFLFLFRFALPVFAFVSLCLSAIISWTVLHLADSFAGVVGWRQRRLRAAELSEGQR